MRIWDQSHFCRLCLLAGSFVSEWSIRCLINSFFSLKTSSFLSSFLVVKRSGMYNLCSCILMNIKYYRHVKWRQKKTCSYVCSQRVNGQICFSARLHTTTENSGEGMQNAVSFVFYARSLFSRKIKAQLESRENPMLWVHKFRPLLFGFAVLLLSNWSDCSWKTDHFLPPFPKVSLILANLYKYETTDSHHLRSPSF